MFKKHSFWALLFCIMALTASAQEKISLQKAVDLALQNNLTIKQSAFTEALDEQNLKQAKNNRLPSLSASTQATENFGRALDVTTYQYTSNKAIFYLNPQVSAQMTLFQGGQLRNEIIQNKLQLAADQSYTTKLKNDLTLNVIVNYLQILANQDLVEAAKQQQDIANITLSRTKTNFDVGNQTLADLSQAKAGVSTAQLNLTNAQNQLDISILTLKQYMEINPATPIDIVRPDISKINNLQNVFNANAIVQESLNVNPDIKLAQAQEAVSAQNIKTAKSAYYPTLTLFSGLSSNYTNSQPDKVVGYNSILQQVGVVDGTSPVQTVSVLGQQPVFAPYTFSNKLRDNFTQAIGLNLQIPIFNKFNTRTNVKKARISYENAQISTQIAKNNLTKTIYQAVMDARAAANQYQSATQTYQANKDAFNVIQQRYNVGLVNSLDYNTALSNLNKSENDMIQARYQMVFRTKVIDYYLGKPIIL